MFAGITVFQTGNKARSIGLALRASATIVRPDPERWPSGLRRTLGKRVCVKAYRGFESHSLRHALSNPLSLLESKEIQAV